jgi:sensor histidine kinase YesM
MSTKKGMNREKKATEINDIGFRLILIPFFGIAIPLLTRMIAPGSLSHWTLKLAYGYTIGIAFIIWQGNRYLLFSLRSYFNWFNKPIRKIIALLLAISFFTIPVSFVLLIGWYQLFRGGRVDWEVVRTSTLIIMICVVFITHVYETVFLVKDSENEMLKNEQLERLKAQAELQALKNQIDPHFMFNSLNTLSWLIEEAPVKAKVFNDHLADVYRYILQNKSRDLVIVSEEIHFLYNYFALLKIRYEDAVRLKVDMDENILQQYMMLPISIQVLAENAFKHNEFSIREPLAITVFFEKDRIAVHNRVAKKEKEKGSSGIGLSNLDERCKLATGMPLERVQTKTDFTIYLPVLPID